MHSRELRSASKRQTGVLSILAVCIIIITASPAYGQTRTGSILLKPGESFLTSAVIDATNRFAYFGTDTTPGTIVKVGLSNFTRVGAFTLRTGEDRVRSAIIDVVNGYAYFGTNTSPGIIVKVRLSDFTLDGEMPLRTGEDNLTSAVMDAAHGFAYFGTDTQPGIVVKIRLSDFSWDGALTLNPGESGLVSAVIDATNAFAYFGTNTSPGLVVKVSLSDFTRVDALALQAGESDLNSAVIDTTKGFAYFGTETDPGIVVKIRLLDFTLVDTVSLNLGEGGLSTVVLDQSTDAMYFGTDTASSGTIIVRVALSNFTRIDAITLNSAEIVVRCAVIDPANGYAYFGTYTDPGFVVKVNVQATPPSEATVTTAPSTYSSNTPIASSYLILGLPPETFFAATGGVAIAATSVFLFMRRRQSRKSYMGAAKARSILEGPLTTQPNISTGYRDLDQNLEGGFPEGYRVLLVSPSFDERDLLLRRIIESALSSKRPTVYLSSDMERATDLARRYRDDFHAFCAIEKTSTNQERVQCMPGIGDLSNLNISLSKNLSGLHLDTATGGLFILDILSDVLLQHRLLTTRRWSSDFLAKRRSQRFTVLATLNPFTASREDAQSLMDVFDGVLEIMEKESEGKPRRFVVIKKLYGRRYLENEIRLDKEKLF